jgi:hypothetical protein
MIFRRRIYLTVGLASALALCATAGASAAARLDLETTKLGNVLADEMIAHGQVEIFHPAFAGGCFTSRAFGEYLVTSAPKDSATWEPECEVMLGEGTLELTSKLKAKLTAVKGTVFSFAVPRDEECAWEASKLKGTVTDLNPVKVHLKATAKRFPGENPSCAKTATVEAEYTLWAEERPSIVEEEVKGTIVK